jgi:hypothetical protein
MGSKNTARAQPRMRKHARILLKGLEEALAYLQGDPPKGMRITSFYKRKGMWVRRTRVIK